MKYQAIVLRQFFYLSKWMVQFLIEVVKFKTQHEAQPFERKTILSPHRWSISSTSFFLLFGMNKHIEKPACSSNNCHQNCI